MDGYKQVLKSAISYSKQNRSLPQPPFRSKATYSLLPSCLAGRKLLRKWSIDRYSRYPEVEVVRSTKMSTVIPKIDQMFARHDMPTIIKSDNGPPFNGTEYKPYLEVLGIKAKFSTPIWPQGNAEAERFMQPHGKALKIAHIENRPWQQELSRFLLLYRTTPHVSIVLCEGNVR
jgi:hypothetical protein